MTESFLLLRGIRHQKSEKYCHGQLHDYWVVLIRFDIVTMGSVFNMKRLKCSQNSKTILVHIDNIVLQTFHDSVNHLCFMNFDDALRVYKILEEFQFGIVDCKIQIYIKELCQNGCWKLRFGLV
jgi:hypothetical protein